jgi:DcuC family C4-dicarboxylate transporter
MYERFGGNGNGLGWVLAIRVLEYSSPWFERPADESSISHRVGRFRKDGRGARMTVAAGLVIIAVAVVAVARGADVRLALTLAALALGTLAGQPQAVVQKFLATFSSEQFVVPICSAMGFAYVLRATGCDQHLVQLLVGPLRRVRPILIPGAVLVGFAVNMPIISQASTLVTVGPVLIPLLRVAGISATTTGAALLLGASLGGELLNPGAPEFRTVASALELKDTGVCVQRIAPPLLVHLAVATGLFWWLSARAEARLRRQDAGTADPAKETKQAPAFRVSMVKAVVPVVPIVLLLVTGPPWQLVNLHEERWLVSPAEQAQPQAAAQALGSRRIAVAMLVGVVCASIAGRTAASVPRAFFEGAGYAFTHIISIIVCATAFGRGVEVIGLAALLGQGLKALPGLLVPGATFIPLAFAFLCGSGFASTQSLFGFFVEPARHLGIDPVGLGAVVSIGSAAGRTMSPVSAVALMSGAMTDTSPLLLTRRVAGPLFAGLAAMLAAKALLGW